MVERDTDQGDPQVPEAEAEEAVEPTGGPVEDGGGDGSHDGEPGQGAPGEGTQEGARLAQAEAAFERGDFRAVRTLVGSLLGATDRRVAERAGELQRAVSIDPVQLAVVILCLIVFIVVVAKYTM